MKNKTRKYGWIDMKKNEKNKTQKYDCIIIGGGPSGLMASIAAAEMGAKTLLLDKGDKLGRKLAISGGGRCNVTNCLPIDEVIKHIPGNGRFLRSAFSQFSNLDIIDFFTKLGVPLKEEDHGRMFPQSDNAGSVVIALIERFRKLGGEIRENTAVKKVLYEHELARGVVTLHNEMIYADAVVIAVGGKSVPHTGSTGDGYVWAKVAGHTITPLFPTEVPVTSAEPFVRKKVLQGLSLQDVAVSVLAPGKGKEDALQTLKVAGKPVVTHRMDLIFTHFGLSGPAILRCSQFVVQIMQKNNVHEVILAVDALPDVKDEQLFQQIIEQAAVDPKKSVKNGLRGLLPERYLLFLLELAEVDSAQTCGNISNEKWRRLVQQVKRFEIRVNGTLPIEKAFVTGGGVSLKEINPKTMASKLVPNLYFCGEILDIHGYTGGYNITAALVTGRIAGMNAGDRVE